MERALTISYWQPHTIQSRLPTNSEERYNTVESQLLSAWMIPLDNSGKGQLQVPGFGDIPLTFELPCQDRFTHGVEEWCQTPAVTLREFAMTTAMDRVTDQEEWHRSVHDVCRLAEWKQAAMAASPLVSDKAWEWCVLELQDKAKFYLNKGFVETLDAGQWSASPISCYLLTHSQNGLGMRWTLYKLSRLLLTLTLSTRVSIPWSMGALRFSVRVERPQLITKTWSRASTQRLTTWPARHYHLCLLV